MAVVMTLRGSDANSTDAVRATADVLSAGGVAVFPTDTVYGIGQAVCANPNGARRLFDIKRRDPRKVVPWLIADAGDLERFGTDVPAWARAMAEHLWPGGLTMVVRASREVPPAFCAADGTIALRIPDCAFVRAVARACASPLATTSANTSGSEAPVSFDAVEPRILEEADVAVDGGQTPAGLSSTIVVCTDASPRIVRVGAVAPAEIERYVAGEQRSR